MLLMTPTQAGDAREQETQRQILRAQEAEKEVARSNQRLSKSKEEFEAMLTAMNAHWEKEQQANEERLAAYRKEVSELESRREKALIPVSIEDERVKKRFKEVAEKERSLVYRQEELDSLAEKLESALDAVGEREQDVSIREEKALSRELGLEEQVKRAQQSGADLQQAIQNWTARASTAEADLSERKRKVELQEISLKAREDKVFRDQEENRLERLRLQDLSATLEREKNR